MTQSFNPNSVLFLGGGAVVAEFHLPALAQLGMLDRVVVTDPSAAALQRLTGAFPTLKTLPLDFASALDRAAKERCTAVVVALPNALHEAAVTRALELGLDVLAEKPLALSRDACARLEALAERESRILAVGMVRRFTPAVQALQRALREGWIGQIVRVEAQDGGAFAWSSESGSYFRPENAGVLANVGVHVFDLIEYLCGEISPVAYSDDAQGGVEANAEFEGKTAAGAPVRVKLSYTHRLENKYVIRGTHGTLWLDKESADRAFFRGCDRSVEAVLTLPKPFQHGDWKPTLESAFAEQFADFFAACASRTLPRATAQDAVRTAALIDWAYSHHNAERIEVVANPGLQGKIIVTGGTGFVGGHLIEKLYEQGADEIVLPVRSYRSGANAGRYPVKMERINLLDPQELQSAMQNARHVFHLAFGRDGENASRVTVEGTKNVVEAAIAMGVESIVLLSTTAVFGNPGNARLVNETFPYAPTNEYEKQKAAAEVWTLARAKQAGQTRIAVINSACIYGPRGKTFTELPAQLFFEHQFAWIENGRGIVNYVYVKNLCDALIAAAICPQAHGKRFIVSDGATTWREFFTLLFGERAARLDSYTPAELQSLARRNAPGMRDLMRAVVRNPEMWRVVRENPTLARAKNTAGRLLPHLYQRVQSSRESSVSELQVPTRLAPPVWLAELYDATTTTLSAAQAQQVLGWSPRVLLPEGQAIARGWLKQVGLWLDE